MARLHTNLSREIIRIIFENDGIKLKKLYSVFSRESNKLIYDCVYRLHLQGYIDFEKTEKEKILKLTGVGKQLALQQNPVRDGVWKIIIFDVPEKKRKIRDHLRSRLIALGFKKWQTSIWVSPYKLSEEIESELKQLSEKLFVRLIKSTDINNTEDLEELFEE